MFNQILVNADYFAPLNERYVKPSNLNLFTVDLLESSIERDRLMACVKNSNDENLVKKAKDKRNEVKTKIKNARSDFYIDKLGKYSGGPNKFWNRINEMIK